MSIIKLNGKELTGPMAVVIFIATLLFIALIFGLIAIIFSAPLWIPLLIGFFIGKTI